MSAIKDRFLALAQQHAPAMAEVEQLATEIQGASADELRELQKAMVTLQRERPDAFTKSSSLGLLFNAHQQRGKALVRSEAVGVYSGPTARFLAESFLEVKRAELLPPSLDMQALEARIEVKASQIVARAEANNVERPLEALDAKLETARSNKAEVETWKANEQQRLLDAFAPVAKALVGVNSGLDQVSAVTVDVSDVTDERMVTIFAHDRAGHNVAHIRLEDNGESDLGIEIFRTAHGRRQEVEGPNTDTDVKRGFGNPLLTVAFMGSVIEAAVTAGYSRLSHGSRTMIEQGFAEKLGWRVIPHDRKLWGDQIELELDLTDKKAVERLLAGVAMAQVVAHAMNIDGLNKDVDDALTAAGKPLSLPNVTRDIRPASDSRRSFMLQAPKDGE